MLMSDSVAENGTGGRSEQGFIPGTLLPLLNVNQLVEACAFGTAQPETAR